MNRISRILIYSLGGLLLLVLAVWFFLIRGFVQVPETSTFHADLKDIRALAGEGGDLPLRIRSIKVGVGAFPDWVAIAGGSEELDEFPADWRAFQIVYPDRTVLIDPVHDRELHEAFPLATEYDDAAFARMQEWLKEASLILATHGHWDHVGGIAASPHAAEIQSRVMLSREQIDGGWLEDATWPEGYLENLKPLEYENLHRVAPGLVLIKAPGHTPGTQMIYLRMRSGREYIFVGDVVWNRANIESLRGHNRFVGLTGQEDLEAKAQQIRWLHDIWKAGEVKLIIAHDQKQHGEYIERGVFTDD